MAGIFFLRHSEHSPLPRHAEEDARVRREHLRTTCGLIKSSPKHWRKQKQPQKFVFESLILTEGILSYKLKFPFNEFVNSNILMARASKLLAPQIFDKKQEVTLKNATSLQIGDPNGIRTHIATVKG